MAKSPLVLNTENPVTSSRIKCARTHTGLTHVERLSNQNTSPRTAGEKAAGPRGAGAAPCPVRPHSGDRGGGGGAAGRPQNATFCL